MRVKKDPGLGVQTSTKEGKEAPIYSRASRVGKRGLDMGGGLSSWEDGSSLSSKWFHLRLTFFLFSNLGLNKPEFLSIVLWLGDDTPHAILSQKCFLWKRDLVKLPQP